MKKLISVLLCAVMLFAFCAPAFATEIQEIYPVVYIEGQGIYLVRDERTAEQKHIYSLQKDVASEVLGNIKPLLLEIAKGFVMGGDYSAYTKTLVDIMNPIYEDVVLGADGMPKDNSAVYISNQWRGSGRLSNIQRTIPVTNGEYPVYRWLYDWRLSPIVLAEELNDLVDAVLAETGAKKVNLVSRCLGTNIAYAYLCNEEYGAKEKINSCVFYAAALEGLGILDALFSGEAVIDAGALDRFLIYYREGNNLVINDEVTTDVIFALVELLEEVQVLGFTTEQLSVVINQVLAQAGPEVLRGCYGSFPSYWSMVSADAYEKARDFVFPTDEDKAEWAGLIAQTDAYYEIEKNLEENLKELSNYINFSVVAKYGLPDFPLSEDGGVDSDAFVSAARASLGAKVTDLDKKLSDSYVKKAKENGTDKYISADRKIDASTCLFPETTWFVKGVEHKNFPDCVNDIIIDFINSDGEMTVFSNPEFTQFMQFTDLNGQSSDSGRGLLTPINTIDDTEDLTNKYTKSKLEALFAFLLKFFKMIFNLFKGGEVTV